MDHAYGNLVSEGWLLRLERSPDRWLLDRKRLLWQRDAVVGYINTGELDRE